MREHDAMGGKEGKKSRLLFVFLPARTACARSQGRDHVDWERKVDCARRSKFQADTGDIGDSVEAEHQGPLERCWKGEEG